MITELVVAAGRSGQMAVGAAQSINHQHTKLVLLTLTSWS